jgi:LPXTG-motif cell wall-anchored protein
MTPTRRHLPRTGSNLSLFELIAGLSLAGGLALRQARTRSAL